MPPAFRIDAVAAAERASVLFNRSVKGAAQTALLSTLVSCVDLTSLEGTDTDAHVTALAGRALRPDEGVGPVAAVCVYPARVAAARQALAGSPVAVASVAGAFPSGLSDPSVVLADVAAAVEAGAQELDIVLDRSRFLSGRLREAQELIAAQVAVADGRPVKVIIESGELGTLENVAAATRLAVDGGAAFVKTSTGKISAGAAPDAVYVMAGVLADHFRTTGHQVGIKVSGGVRHAKAALGYATIVSEVLGPEWMQPSTFRVGASTLLDDLCLQLRFHRDGRYPSATHLPRG